MADASESDPLPPERRNRPLYNELALWIQLGGTIDAYAADRERYWHERLDAEDWTPLKELREIADETAALIRKRAMALRNLGEVSELNAIYRSYQHEREDASERAREQNARLEASLRAAMPDEEVERWMTTLRSVPDEAPDPEREGEHPLRLIWEELCARDAWDVVEDIPQRVRRILQLERLIDDVLGRRGPPEACIRFLALVSRCYIFGFNTECVVMCRSAMEQAFHSMPPLQHTAGGLAEMIKAAAHPKSGPLISGEEQRWANDVKERGNKAAHYEPEATKNVLGTIERTLRVIDRLSAAETR